MIAKLNKDPGSKARKLASFAKGARAVRNSLLDRM